MNGLKGLAGRKITKEIEVDGSTITIHKLSVQGAKAVQEVSKLAQQEDDKRPDDAGLQILKVIITQGTSEELSDDDFANIPMDTLQKVSEAIMTFSGMAPDPESGND